MCGNRLTNHNGQGESGTVCNVPKNPAFYSDRYSRDNDSRSAYDKSHIVSYWKMSRTFLSNKSPLLKKIVHFYIKVDIDLIA